MFLVVLTFAAVAAPLDVYDTNSPSGGPLAAMAMTLTSKWKEIPVGAPTSAFSGDAVLMNDRLALVVRKHGEGVEVYTNSARGKHLQATLSPVCSERVQGDSSVTIAAYTKDSVTVELWRKTESGKRLGVRFRFDAGATGVEAEPLGTATRLRVAAPHRYAVIPYSSGDDIVLDAAQIKGESAEFSGENWLAQFLSTGDAILMIERSDIEQDFQLSVTASDPAHPSIRSADVAFGAGGKISVTIQEHADLWRVGSLDTGKGKEERIQWRWYGRAPWRPDEPISGQYREFESGGQQAKASEPFARLYDTGTPSDEPLPAKKIAGCTSRLQVPEGATPPDFKGDAVVMNDKLAVVLRKNGPGVELYARGGSGALYAVLRAATPESARKLVSVAVVQNGQDAVVLDAMYATDSGRQAGLRLTLSMGQGFVRADPLAETSKLVVDGTCRFAILPDFFADDMVLDALELPVDAADVPGENFLLQMLGDGEAILMAVWEKNDQDVRLNLSGAGPERRIQSLTIALEGGKGAWISLMADPGIWFMQNIEAKDKGREIPLSWRCPFPALWRVDWRRDDGMTDSWEMLSEIPGGQYKKHGLFSENEDAWTSDDWWGSGPRTRIASGLGRFHYPCWVNLDGSGYLEPLAEKLNFQGPAIIYPINRLIATPLDKMTVVDVVRGTMGVGPCKYILDVEGQNENFKGMPTCSVREILDAIYEKGAQAQERAKIEQALVDVVDFISLIRKRIDDYGTFAQELTAYLETEKQANPAVAAFATEMQGLARRIDDAIASRKESIHSIEYAADLATDFRKRMLDYSGADAAAQCKTYTSRWVEIGGNQDTLVAECRMIVRLLRQRGAMAGATDPRLAEIAGEIRKRTQAILRNPVNYEAPRH